MANDRTERLIVDLVADAAPVRRLPAVSVRTVQWLAIGVAAAAGGVWAIGARSDLALALASPDVEWSVGLAVAAAVTAAVASLRLSVPGADQSPWGRWLPVMIAGLWIGLLLQLARAAGVSTSAFMREPFHPACGLRIVIVSLIPTLVLLHGVRAGFAIERVSAIALAVLGGTALAAAAIQLVCPIDRPAHLLWAHAFPTVALTMIAAIVVSRERPSRT